MSDKKLTDNEIVKECRKKGLQNGSTLGFHSGFMDIIADRFEELIAEINRLKNELHLKVEYIHEQVEVIDEKKAEIERLKEEKDEYAYLYNKHINTAFSHIKAEAYKECIGKVKEYIDTYEHLSCEECECVPISKDELDNLLKELVGEK